MSGKKAEEKHLSPAIILPSLRFRSPVYRKPIRD
jgi:hypothetical protein